MVVEWLALGVSILALILTFTKDFFIPLLFKPKIDIIGKDDGECVVTLTDTYNLEDRWMRLRLINKKSFFTIRAKKCYVKLLSIKDEKNEKIIPFESLPLSWVNYDDNRGGKYDLNIGEYHMIDLVHESKPGNNMSRFLSFKVDVIPFSLIKKVWQGEKLGPGIYILKVGVFGNNFTPLIKEFKIKLTNKFGELNFVKDRKA